MVCFIVLLVLNLLREWIFLNVEEMILFLCMNIFINIVLLFAL